MCPPVHDMSKKLRWISFLGAILNFDYPFSLNLLNGLASCLYEAISAPHFVEEEVIPAIACDSRRAG
jgi:hypothetical protein